MEPPNIDPEFISEEEYEENKDNLRELSYLTEVGKRSLEKVEKNYSLKQNQDNLQPTSTEGLRIVVIGKTGVGKSATANAILGVKVFTDSKQADSFTFESKCVRKEINGRTVSVIDTPGLQDTSRPQDEVLREIARVMKIFHDGVHVFVYVLNMASHRFTEEDKTALFAIEAKFGDNMKKYRMLVFTHAESVLKGKTNLEAVCQVQMQSNTPLSDFLKQLDGNIVAVNNSSEIPAEVKRNQNVILGLADKIAQGNNYAVYSNHMFEQASEERKKCIEKLLGRGFNPTVMESVETVIAEKPNVAEKKGRLVKEVRKQLENSRKIQEQKIADLRIKRTKEDISCIEQELSQDEREAEEKLQKTTHILQSNVIEKEAEEVGKKHFGVLNELQRKFKQLKIWKNFGV